MLKALSKRNGAMMDLRQIDALVAEHVMGWRSCGDCWALELARVQKKHTWKPSIDIAAAWEAFEYIGGGYSVCDKWVDFSPMLEIRRIDSPSHAEWRCTIDTDEGRYESVGHTAPLAICLAALKAKGVEIDTL